MIWYVIKLIIINDDLLAATLSKLLKIGQNNAAKLDDVLDNQEKFQMMQEKFQAMLDAQQSQISAIMAEFASQPEETIKGKGKGKGKGKVDDEFYHVSIHHFLRQFLMLFLLIIICITGCH